MKMETIITATLTGIVQSIHAQPLDSVNAGDLLVTIVKGAATDGGITPRPASPAHSPTKKASLSARDDGAPPGLVF